MIDDNAPDLPALPPSVSNAPEELDPVDEELPPAPIVMISAATYDFWLAAFGEVALLVVGLVLFLAHRITQSAFLILWCAAGAVVPIAYGALAAVARRNERAREVADAKERIVRAMVTGRAL